jgi:hypothetical protein
MVWQNYTHFQQNHVTHLFIRSEHILQNRSYTVRTCSHHNVTRYTVCITLVYVSFSLQTLQDLRNSYVPGKTVQVAIQCTWCSTVCVYRRKFSLNLDSNTPKADRQLYDRPAAPVSPNSILPPTPTHCPFITSRKTSVRFQKRNYLNFSFFNNWVTWNCDSRVVFVHRLYFQYCYLISGIQLSGQCYKEDRTKPQNKYEYKHKE